MPVRFALRGAVVAAALLLVAGCERSRAEPRVLVFGGPDAATRQTAQALVQAARDEGLSVRMTSDPTLVVEDSLARYRGFILLNTSGDELGRRPQADLERFVEAGGVMVDYGARPAATWPWLEAASASADAGVVRVQTSSPPGVPLDLTPGDVTLADVFARLAEGAPRPGRARTERVPDSTRFVQQLLVEGTLNEPTEMAIASDGRVFFNERRGALKVYEPATGGARVVHQFELFTEDENGLIGLALDPGFDQNGWMYITRTVGDTTDIRHRVARFTYDGQGITDERVLFDVPVDRGCCHTGGSMAFDAQGNLLVSFGDNTNPFATPYAPIDDRPGRALWDARRSSANTQDLRGKIVRITPQADGSYTIPEGNLFSDPAVGRPEIYTMGHRNPYRISVDGPTGFVYWGEVGPDARIDSVPGPGPRGYDEVNQARTAGNFGWPLFIADNRAYSARNFDTGVVGAPFDAATPVNDSRFNTGAQQLPPAQPAMIFYPYDRSEQFPWVGEGGRTAMAGPVFRADAFPGSETRLPEYYDGKFIHYEWIRGWMMATTLDENGDFVRMEPFLDHLTFDHPMDVELGPDGSLYVLEYGTLWFAPNPGARLTRIIHHPENRPPRARITATPEVGAAPLEVTLSAAGSTDPDGGDRLRYLWEFPDGETATGESVTRSFAAAGEQLVRLVVSDGAGAADTAQVTLRAGNAPPEVEIAVDGNRSFFWGNTPLSYHVAIRDTEDGTLDAGVDPERVRVTLDYQATAVLEAAELGHRTEQTPAGLAYIQQGDCTGCHGIDQASAGPSYRSVAARYAGADSAEEHLVRKIIEGGSGVWGEQVMPAHPDMSGDVAAEIVRYILSLATPGEALPVQGTVPLGRHAAGEAGAYVLTASYVDEARDGAAPIEGRDQVVLRFPVIRAVDIADRSGLGGVADSLAAGGALVPLPIEADGAYLHAGLLDLTGVARITVILDEVADDLVVELRQGSAAGDRLAGGTLSAAAAATGGAGGAALEVPLEVSAEGEHDLFVVFRSEAPTLGPWSPAARVLAVRFDRSAP